MGAALGKLGASKSGDSAALPAEQAFHLEALAKDRQHLLLRWTMPKGYYLYRDQTALKLKDANGLTLAKPEWPAGVEHQDAHFGKTTVYFDQIDVPVAIEGDTAALKTVNLEASFQGCQDGGLCYPLMTRALTIDLSAATPTSGVAAEPAPEMPPAGLATGALQVSLFTALLLALGGGLVLNLMPCVLPVLSIKAVGLLESGESHGKARSHALFYTAGVLSTFALIGIAIVALRSAGHALGWGAQLQQPLVVGVLACVMVAVGLSMSGVVQFGTSLGNVGSGLASRSGHAGDFFTGVLAVAVASPCTAPFMGSCAGLRLRRADDQCVAGLPDAGHRPGPAVPGDRLRPGAGAPAAAPGRLDGNAQAGAGVPDVSHRRVADLGAGACSAAPMRWAWCWWRWC